MQWTGKCVWITGASSGIGEAFAHAAVAQGANVILSARRQQELERVKASLRTVHATQAIHVVTMDLDDTASLPGVVERALACEGAVDIMVHNAGISQRSLAAETQPSVDERLMRVNYLGPVVLTKALLPSMRQRRTGRFVVVSSLTGVFGTPMRSGYAASKHALHGFFDSLRAELVRDNVKVTIVCPGFVQTDVSRNALRGDGKTNNTMDHATSRGITAEACANEMVKAIVQGRDEIYVGGWERFGVYAKRYFPWLYRKMIARVKVT